MSKKPFDVEEMLKHYNPQVLEAIKDPDATIEEDKAAGTVKIKYRRQVNDDYIKAWIVEHNEDAVFFDGYEDALIGIATRCSNATVAVYDAEKCVQILMDRDGMSEEDAEEFFSFNTLGCWAGDNTPLFYWAYEPEDG